MKVQNVDNKTNFNARLNLIGKFTPAQRAKMSSQLGQISDKIGTKNDVIELRFGENFQGQATIDNERFYPVKKYIFLAKTKIGNKKASDCKVISLADAETVADFGYLNVAEKWLTNFAKSLGEAKS